MVNIAQASQRRAAAVRAAAAQPPLSFGVLYPRNTVVAVIDDEQQAEPAARTLRDAGIPGDQIDVLSGRYFDTLLAETKRRRGLISRLGACLSRLFSDDADFEQTLLDEARQNHALLVIHAVDPSIAEHASGILRVYGAHGMQYYRRGSIEDLV